MLSVLLERLRGGRRTLPYPRELPGLPERFRGLPVLDAARCHAGCGDCADACPTGAIAGGPTGPRLDLGRCLFCTDCVEACAPGALTFSRDHRLAARGRADLVLDGEGLRL